MFELAGKYEQEFPFVSPCGREINYVRCDDVPCVFTHFVKGAQGETLFGYAHAGDLLCEPFDPASIFMFDSGRIYHPAHERFGGYGLIKSSIALELSNKFVYATGNDQDRPTHIVWDGDKIKLNNVLESKFENRG